MKNFYIFLVAILSMNSLTAQNWECLNPKPTGNLLYNLCYTDANTWYVSGIRGMILKSTDRGATWSNLNTGTMTSFWDLFFTEKSTGYAVGENEIFKTTDEGTTWIGQEVAIGNLVRVDFPGINTGYAISNYGGMVKTIDGGTAWNVISGSGPLYCLLDVKFTSLDTGFVAGQNFNGTATIMKTIDGGNTWFDSWVSSSGYTGAIYALFFTAPKTGYAVGTYGTILKTTNAGNTWIEISTGWTYDFYSVYFPDTDTGYITSVNGPLLKTTNAGNFWSNMVPPDTYSLIIGCFSDPSTGIMIGSKQFPEGYISTIYKTTNGGSSITSLNSGLYANLYSVSFPDANTGYAAGDSGVIVKTTDAGGHWARLVSGTSTRLNSVSFPTTNTGYAVGESGKIVRTSNGGANWSSPVSGTNQNLHSVSFTDDNTGYAVGDWGTVLKTINGGTLWETMNSGTTRYLFSVHFINALTGYVVGSWGTIRKTTDGGLTWTEQSSGTTEDILSVYFVDENTGYTVSQNGPVLKTTNGGITWEDFSSGIYGGGISVYFKNESTGYIVGNYADMQKILQTVDGGAHWNHQSPGTDKTLRAVCITASNNAYAVGDLGAIERTTGGVGINFTSPGRNLMICPNPAKHRITIETDGISGKSNLVILNSIGQELLNQQLTDIRTQIDISALVSGVYILRLTNEKSVSVGKLIKE